MSLLLYGIVAESVTLTLAPPFQLISANGLSAIVQACESELSREAEPVLAYGKHIMLIHQQTTLIPVRYGSVLANQAVVIEHLARNSVAYHSRLAVLEDCEEMGIRLPLPTESEIAPSNISSGYDYLLARKRAYAVSEAVLQQSDLLNNALASLYREHCAELSVFNGQRTYLLSYLVPRCHLTAFKTRLTQLNDELIDKGFISGPWPVYNFACLSEHHVR
ncbi:MAG: GvpL/GvpF family gas vesicle protein [Methylococcaceae bacterium]